MINKLTFLHYFTATLLVETIMLFLFRYTNSPFTGKAINRWYDNLGWTAIILDVMAVLLGFYLAKYLYLFLLKNKIRKNNTILNFLFVLLFVQIVHDLLFYYIVIKNTPVGVNKVMDEFKNYAEDVRFGAVIGDSFMYIISMFILYGFDVFGPMKQNLLISGIVKNNTEINTFISILCIYLIGYFLHQKPLYI